MAVLVYNSTNGGSGVGLDLGLSDSLILGPSGLIYSTGSFGVQGIGVNQSVLVSGLVSSTDNDAIHFNNGTGNQTGIRVTIAASGHLQAGDDGVEINGINQQVINHGSIDGAFGMYLGSSAAFTTARVLNTGTIHATQTAIATYFNDFSAVSLVNEGIIVGTLYSFFGGKLADTVENSGVMRGKIFLDVGNDTYNGAAGRVVGTIEGDGGKDTFIVGSYVEVINGGSGIDTLDFTKTGGIRVALDGSFANTGVATGDTYTAIEVLKGSITGSDVFTGDASANSLYGFGGEDRLSGGGGADALVGGKGADVLRGGLGNDHFYFNSRSEAGDLINDFSNASANNDDFRIKGSAFGTMLTGALSASKFQSRADNHAQDADDRFIFRTTDKTLWFDANGSVAGGLTMLADLQATAVVTAADIILI